MTSGRGDVSSWDLQFGVDEHKGGCFGVRTAGRRRDQVERAHVSKHPLDAIVAREMCATKVAALPAEAPAEPRYLTEPAFGPLVNGSPSRLHRLLHKRMTCRTAAML